MTYEICSGWQQQPALIPFSLITVRTAQQPYSYGCLRVLGYGFFPTVNGKKSDTTAPPITPLHHRWSNSIKSRA